MPDSEPEYVTEQELLELHGHALALYGGGRGIRDAAALESCLAQPIMDVFGTRRFPALHDKAAAYAFFIVRNHPFVDGNKRTAFLAALHFLLKNGIVPVLDQDEAYSILIGVAEGKLGLEELRSLFRRAAENLSEASE